MEIFQSKCQLCHVTHPVTPAERAKLLGPPIDEVMLRVKEKYPISENAVAFIVDYIFHPSIDKVLCPSIDTYGLMPSMAKKLSKKEAEAVAQMLFETFPVQKKRKNRKDDNVSVRGKSRDSSH
ncbi:hypothetical protein [Nitratifractor salsuginis]|nr:hypothetical protein [Nitratifractor salsuginis]